MKSNTTSATIHLDAGIFPNTLRIGNEVLLTDNFRAADVMFKSFRIRLVTAAFFHQGECDITIQMRLIHVKAPCLLLFLPNQTVQCHPAMVHPVVSCMSVSEHTVHNLVPNRAHSIALYQSILEYPVISFPEDYLSTVNLYLASLRETLRHGDNPHRLEAVQHLTQAFFLSMPQLKKAQTAAKSHKEEVLFDFLTELREHFRSERTIEFYANQLCLSSKHLSRVVKQTSGRTVHNWIDEYVSAEATALLLNSDKNVSQVADELGFASQPLFTKFYRRTTGLNPSEVLKKK